MTWPDLKTWPPLLAVVALLVAGAWIYQDGEATTGAALLAAGLVVLGAWLATILRDPIQAQKTEYIESTDDPPRRDEA